MNCFNLQLKSCDKILMPVRIKVTSTTSEEKTGKGQTNGDFSLALSLTQLLFKVTYSPYLLYATYYPSYSFLFC